MGPQPEVMALKKKGRRLNMRIDPTVGPIELANDQGVAFRWQASSRRVLAR